MNQKGIWMDPTAIFCLTLSWINVIILAEGIWTIKGLKQ